MPAELLDSLSVSGLRRYAVSLDHADRTFPFMANRYDTGAHIRRHLHCHSEHEIVYARDDGTFLYEGAELRFRAGDVILNASGHFHHPVFDREENHGLVVLYFDPMLLTSTPPEWSSALASLQDRGQGFCLLSDCADARQLVLEALQHFQSGDPNWQVLCQGALLHLLSLFVHELASNGKVHDCPYATRLGKAVRYIDEKLCEPIAMEEVYAAAGMSRSTFCRHFRVQYGMSAQDYIRIARLTRAKSMLSGSSLPVGEIAWRCGFASTTLFNRTFRKWAGITPSAFRKSVLS